MPSVRRQCCIAHDGGDRTLRAHCKKSAEHLPLPSGNDAYESLHLLSRATNPSPDPDRCSQIHRCLAVPVPTFRLRDSLSECYITGRCLPAMTPRVLVNSSWETRSERKRTSSEGQSQSTALQIAVYLPDYRAAFAFSQFRYPHRHRSALRLIFPLRGAIRAYPVPRR